MRWTELGGRAHPTATDDKNDLRQNEIAQAQFFFKRDALSLDFAFFADQFSPHNFGATNVNYMSILAFLGGRWFWRRWFVSKFAVPDFSTGIRDVSAHS